MKKPMKQLVAAAAAITVVGLSTSAFAETLTYDFAMTVTQLSDAVEPGYSVGVFEAAGITTGGTLNVSVALNTAGDGDGTASINVQGLNISTNSLWYSNSWTTTWSQSGDTIWEAGSGTGAGLLAVNTIQIPYGSVSENLYLDFSTTSSGDLALNSGYMTIAVDNSIHAKLRAEVTNTAVSVPELDPTSGMTAIVLLLGGAALAFASRPRLSVTRA